MSVKKPTVIGARGIVGGPILEYLLHSEEWEAIGTARNIPRNNCEKIN